jgi:hypothetical protein
VKGKSVQGFGGLSFIENGSVASGTYVIVRSMDS